MEDHRERQEEEFYHEGHEGNEVVFLWGEDFTAEGTENGKRKSLTMKITKEMKLFFCGEKISPQH